MRWLRRHGFVRPNTPVTRDETVVSQDEIVMDHDESQVRDELVDKPAEEFLAEDSQLIVPPGQEPTATKHPRSDADCMDSYQSAPKKQKAVVATAGIKRKCDGDQDMKVYAFLYNKCCRQRTLGISESFYDNIRKGGQWKGNCTWTDDKELQGHIYSSATWAIKGLQGVTKSDGLNCKKHLYLASDLKELVTVDPSRIELESDATRVRSKYVPDCDSDDESDPE